MVVRSTMWTIVLLAVDRIAAVLAPFSYATRTKMWHGKAAGAAVIFYSSIMVIIMSTTTKQVLFANSLSLLINEDNEKTQTLTAFYNNCWITSPKMVECLVPQKQTLEVDTYS